MAEQQTTLSIDFLAESVARKYTMPGKSDKRNIGLELELFPMKADEAGYYRVADIINEQMNGTYDLLYTNSLCRCSMFDPDKKLDVPRLNSAAGGIVTFEPGGQIEYSSGVDTDLNKVVNELIMHMSELENVLAGKGHRFFFGALNPWQSVDEVGLKMRKPRYLAMDRFFNQIGPYGRQMMRLSGSIQVNLDFGNSETITKRWIVTNLLSPVFSAIFGNSPFLAGKASGMKSYRTVIWQNLDKTRTGFPHLRIGQPRIESIIEQYLEFALNANVFTLPDESGCLVYRQNDISFKSWLENGYNGYFPSIEDWEAHLTTLFPDVRAKGFLECRFIDGQSKPCWAIPAIVATALIYDEKATEKTISLLSPYQGELEKMAFTAASTGVEAFPELCREVFELALNTSQYRIDSDLLAYCERFFQHFTLQKKNPADDLLSINNGLIFAADQYIEYEDKLFDIIQPPAHVAAKNANELAWGCKC